MGNVERTPSLENLLELFITGKPDSKEALNSLTSRIGQALTEGHQEQAGSVLRQAVLPTLDYASSQVLLRLRRELRKTGVLSRQKTKLAMLSGFTSTQLIQFVDLFLFAADVDVEIYEADYGTFRQEILDPGSQLYSFEPQFVFIAPSWRDLGHFPDLRQDDTSLQQLVEAELADWSSLWQSVRDRLSCQIIQNNFDLPPWRVLANHEMRHPAGQGHFIAEINAAFSKHAPPFVTIHDVEHLSACWGKWAWADERFYHLAKIPCDPGCLVDYAHSVASLILAHLGLSRKCLVMDLDNTLWGGIVGDDGIDGIRLGQGDPESEAYLAFQRYIKGLQLRGVILAVCSKNEDANAKEPFEQHPDMILKLEDISCFMANWSDKATNLRAIAKQLNIGLDSLVMVDDNPAERALIRQLVPEVSVPELPADPAGFVQALDRCRCFQVVSLRKEDFKRTSYYHADAQRVKLESSAEGIESFLESLQMVARIGPVEPATLARSTQLISKTNQFNTTTRRRSTAEVEAILEDDNWITRTVSLSDRFGDNGLISVILAKVEGKALSLDTWLMSCRVFKRGVEYFLMNHLCKLADTMGLTHIRGQYIPTAKNVPVRDLYAELGFTKTAQDDSTTTSWELAITDWKAPKFFIEERTANG